MKVGRVIRATDERAGGNVQKTLFARNVAVIIELLRCDILENRQVFRRGPKVLPHRQNLAAGFAQIIHRLEKFSLFLAEAEHYAALCYDFGRQFFGAPQDLERSPILGARAHERGQTFHRFHVVIINIGPGIENDLDAPALGVKVGHQYFDNDRWIHLANRRDSVREMIGAAVLEIVAGDRGDDDMF